MLAVEFRNIFECVLGVLEVFGSVPDVFGGVPDVFGRFPRFPRDFSDIVSEKFVSKP